MRTAVVIVNLGTPDEPTTGSVRKYLTQFLNDPRVIDLPWLSRKLLVNGIIVPFRASKSAHEYKKLWTEKGSPLKFITEGLRSKLQEALGSEADVFMAMRYQNPGLDSVLDEVKKKNYKKVVVVPLFPQYASSSTGSVMEAVMKHMSRWWALPELTIVNQFYDHPKLMDAYVSIGSRHQHQDYDHVLFSFHGLPVRQVDKVYEDGMCSDHNCEDGITADNHLCYKATCYYTANTMAEKLGIPADKFTVCFQSRLDQKWLEPFSDKVVEEMGKAGKKKLLVFSPAFVADCLETIVEIGGEYQEIFESFGGEKIQLVESLNEDPMWVDALATIVRERL